MESPAKINEGIFISYRRDGGSTFAGILYYELCRHFTSGLVFKDVNTLKPGSDYKKEIKDAIAKSAVLLVLIDKNWAYLKNENGDRKITDSKDLVRTEIKESLRANVEVIPVLFENGVMPANNELPKDITALCDKNAFIVHPESVVKDINLLVGHIKSSRKYLFDEKTISGSYERLFKDPITTIKNSWAQNAEVLKKDLNYLKGFLNRKKKH